MKRLLVVLLGVSAFVAGAKTINVDYATGTDEDQASVYKTLNFAATKAGDGDEIVLARGPQYMTASATFDVSVTLRGEGENSETTLAGWDSNSTLLYMTHGGLIHNLTIYGCFGDGHANVRLYMNGGGTVVSNIVVTAPRTSPSAPWGDMMIEMNDPAGVITHCWMTNCVAKKQIVKANSAKAIENCVITGNTTGGDLMYLYNIPLMRHCTIAGNTFTAGKAVFIQNNGTGASLYNNIIYGNVNTSTKEDANIGYNFDRHLNNLYSNCLVPTTGCPEDNNNTDDDPLLMEDGYHFLSSSPCNQAGDPDHSLPTDIEGHARGATPSIGACEYVTPAKLCCAVTVIGATTVCAPEAVQLDCAVDGPVAEPLAYAWDFDGDGKVDATDKSPAIPAAGVYRPSVTVTDAASRTACATAGVVVAIHKVGAETFYVDYVNGNDDNVGTSAGAGAWKTIAPLSSSALLMSGDEVVLSRGEHPVTTSLTVSKTLWIHGEGEKEETLLYGSSAMITFSGAGTLLSDLTINGASGSSHGDVRLYATAAMTVSNAVIRALDEGSGAAGTVLEGVKTLSHLWVTNCVYGEKFIAGSPVCDNCLFADTRTTKSGAGAGSVFYGAPSLRNCTIVGNRTWARPVVTFNGNSIAPKVCNCIVRDNYDAQAQANRFCIFYGGGTSDRNIVTNCVDVLDGATHASNFIADPQFRDAENGNYALKVDSPCRNAGDDGRIPSGEKDLLGQPRVFGRHVDLGCFELQQGYGLMLFVR